MHSRLILALSLIMIALLAPRAATADPAPCRQKYDAYLSNLDKASDVVSTILKQDSSCLEASNDCERCTRLDDGTLSCPPIGFTCTPGTSVCTRRAPSQPAE
nr:hypothetical protein [uncultured Cohaesibacter sp.]